MSGSHLSAESSISALPLPLAQLSRRAQNAKSALERHHAAYYLWAAALKLLGGVATVEYLALSQRDAELSACLENLEEQEQGAVPFPVRLGVEVNDGALDVMFTQIQTERSVNAIQLKWLDKPTALQTALAA